MKKATIAFVILTIIIAVLLIFGNRHIETMVMIDATVEKVWDDLADFKSYPEWNPFIKKLSGDVETGKTIEVTFQTGSDDPMVFTPKIIQFEKNKIIQWEGKLLLPGIFTGKHTFELVEITGKRTKLIQKEDFNGILVPVFNFQSTIDGFTAMNKALKKRIEGK